MTNPGGKADPRELSSKADSSPSRYRDYEALVLQNTKLAQEVAQLRDAVAARDTFLAVAAHELRNPMTPIVGRVQRLRRILRMPDFQTETLEENLEQIEWLVAQYVKRATTLLDLSRVTTGKVALNLLPTNIDIIVREVVENFRPLADYAGSALICQLPEDHIRRQCDRLALEQILDNLVSNAVKYGEAGPITVAAREEADTQHIVLEVQDHGPGIPLGSQSRIFERFERAVRPADEGSGFGVGLWVVRQLVETMAGTITILSQPGEGSTFTVVLPLSLTEET